MATLSATAWERELEQWIAPSPEVFRHEAQRGWQEDQRNALSKQREELPVRGLAHAGHPGGADPNRA